MDTEGVVGHGTDTVRGTEKGWVSYDYLWVEFGLQDLRRVSRYRVSEE